MFDVLEAEWEVFNRRRDVRRFMDRLTSDPLMRAASPDELVTRISCVARHDPDRCDAMLRVLVALARHDLIAHRIVLQVVRPKLRILARRLVGCRRVVEQEEIAGDVWSMAAGVISSYPLERRPQRIAANICFDTLKQFHKHTRVVTNELPCDYGDVADLPLGLAARSLADSRSGLRYKAVEDRIELTAMLRHAYDIGLLPDREYALIVLTRLLDADPDEIAVDFDVTGDVVRRARLRAERRLGRRFAHVRPALLAA